MAEIWYNGSLEKQRGYKDALEKTERQQSFDCLLYEKIPVDHLLKKVDHAVDFSFINELLEGSYC